MVFSTPSFLEINIRTANKDLSGTHEGPASKTRTEKLGFSVRRLAITFPAVPPDVIECQKSIARVVLPWPMNFRTADHHEVESHAWQFRHGVHDFSCAESRQGQESGGLKASHDETQDEVEELVMGTAATDRLRNRTAWRFK